jgi:hypothetical protein
VRTAWPVTLVRMMPPGPASAAARRRLGRPGSGTEIAALNLVILPSSAQRPVHY